MKQQQHASKLASLATTPKQVCQTFHRIKANMAG
jgi:hypothetical protein